MICFWGSDPEVHPKPLKAVDRLEVPGERISPVGIRRLAHAAVGRLGAVGVDADVRALEDGRLAVVLAPAWAELFLANLEAQATAFKERLHRARCEAAIREAELRAQLEASRRQVEVENAGIRAEYAKLIAAGLSHREAIRELKRLAGGRLTATELSWVVPPKKKGAGPGTRARRRRPSASQVPDSPDSLVRLWATTPAPTLEAHDGRTLHRYWRRRAFSWRTAFARRDSLSTRALWAAFSREQAWLFLSYPRFRRHEYREARLALRLGRSPRTGVEYQEQTLRRLAQLVQDHDSGEAARREAWVESALPGTSTRRREQAERAVAWFRQRWLPEAEALAQLRAHGIAV